MLIYGPGSLSRGVVAGLLLYFGLNAVSVPLLTRSTQAQRRYIVVGLFLADLLYASFLIYHTGALVSQLFLLYCLLTFKAAIYYPYIHGIIYLPFSIFPLYAATLYLATGTLVSLSDQLFVTRYFLMLIVIFAALYTAWHLDSRHQETRDLLEQLGVEHRHIDERRRELRAVLNSIGDGVLVVDPKLRLLMINPVAASLFKLPYPQPASVPLTSLVQHPDLLALLVQTLQESDGRGDPLSSEVEARPANARKPIVCQALATALVGEDGSTHGAVVVLRDMTRQRELEESKNNFISVLSHELRTPLTAIRGFLDLLMLDESSTTKARHREYIGIAFDQTNRLQQLINSLLEFAEMEAAETVLNPNYESPGQLVQNVLNQIEPLADQRAIALDVQISPDLQPMYADGPRLERVLLNLLDNAIKFTPEHGEVRLCVTETPTETVFCVTDTGIGVPLEERDRIFERFYQIDSSSTREHGGTGLGLALCKHIVEMHGGRIWMEPARASDAEGDHPGSCFYFTIPRDALSRLDLVQEQISDTKP